MDSYKVIMYVVTILGMVFAISQFITSRKTKIMLGISPLIYSILWLVMALINLVRGYYLIGIFAGIACVIFALCLIKSKR